jgi:hypothetical protein
MTMKPFIFVLAIVSTATFTQATAETYRWKDSNGRTMISDTPPPGTTRQSKSTYAPLPTPPEKPLEATKSTADRELEFKKRQQETKEKAEKESKEKIALADKTENCNRARQQLSMLESGQRISSLDSNGERKFMEDPERQKEIEQTRKYLAESCK